MTRQQLIEFVEENFNISPDYPFDKEHKTAIFRHKRNRKWFCAIIKVAKNKIVGDNPKIVDILNTKCDPMLRQPLLNNNGIYEAYHMNKVHWISIILEEVTIDEIAPLIEMSFNLTKK